MSEYIFERLREERKRMGRTQDEFAAIAGVTRVPYAKWESKDGALPSAQNLALMADAGADVLYILTGRRSLALPAEAVLPPDERLLVDNYRSCTPEAKRNLIQTSALLSAGLGGGGVASAPGKRVTQTIHANASVGGSVVAGDMVVGSKGRKR